MQKSIIFGGSFDPIHVAHITIAQKARSLLGVDHLYFLPTQQNPLKKERATSPQDRLAMIHLATRSLPWAKILTYEVEQPTGSPIYTVETMEALYREKIIVKKPYFLIGDDLLASLPHWHRINDLYQLVDIVVINRHSTADSSLYPFEFINIPPLNISSSAIRSDLALAHQNSYLHPDVWRYINENNLYH